MTLEVFNGSSIPREFATAPMEYLLAKWKVLSATGDLTLRRLSEDAGDRLRPHLTLLTPLGDDFVHVYVGEAVQREPGEDRGRLSQSGAPLANELAGVYRRASRHLKPAFVRYTDPRGQAGTVWQQLVLPVPLADAQTMLAVYSEQISYSLEIYEHLFRTASDAMIVACPIANELGHTVDGWVLMMNDRARACLRFAGSIGNLRLRDLPQFRGIAVWGRLHATKGAAAAQLATDEFDLDLMRFPRAFGLRLRPKPGTAVDAPLVPAATAPTEVATADPG